MLRLLFERFPVRSGARPRAGHGAEVFVLSTSCRLVATVGRSNVGKIRKTRFADERPTITPVQCMW